MKIMIAMSGGVDSSTVAYMLKNQGHEVEGVYMKLHNKPNYHEANIKKVEKIAKYLDIKYHILDLSKKFDKFVYKPFIESYKRGETPNPCVLCNRTIKFGELVEFAKERECDKLATGHYVDIKDGFIAEAKDKSKDQSYFLSNIKKENIPYLLFPLNDTLKKDLKEAASKIDILKEFSTQKESSEICFVDTTYIDVLKDHTDTDMPGNVIDKEGNIIGKHKGYMYYTIGKRRGFEVFGALEPHYVTKINPNTNEITVGSKDELKIKSFFIKDVNLFIDDDEFEAGVKIRYRSPKTPCKVILNKDNNSAEVILDEPVFGLASGQMAVFYENEKVIAGGWIA
jgi:tRNA-specific 2-thiouridylase